MASSEIISANYLVCKTEDSILIKIQGNANYLNVLPLKDFLDYTLTKYDRYCIFFEACTGLDSTVLGILASLLLKLKQKSGVCIFCGLQSRPRECVQMLGLDALAILVPTLSEISHENLDFSSLTSSKDLTPDVIVNAHTSLMEITARNKIQFQEIVSMLNKKS